MAREHGARETWLQDAVEALRHLFKDVDKQVPPVLVSAGWGRSKGSKVHGTCYAVEATAGKAATIFISPEMDEGDPVLILGVLLHEMIHAADNCESKHRGWFKRTATALGLVGSMTSTEVGDQLKLILADVAKHLGPYPHTKLDTGCGASGPKPDKNRQLLVECPTVDCEWKVRGSRKVLDMGLPMCPIHGIHCEEKIA